MKPILRLHCTTSLPHNGQAPMMWQTEAIFQEGASRKVVRAYTSWVSNPGLALSLARDQFFARDCPYCGKFPHQPHAVNCDRPNREWPNRPGAREFAPEFMPHRYEKSGRG